MGIKFSQSVAYLNCTLHRTPGMIFQRQGRTKDCHQSIANVFIKGAFVLKNGINYHVKIIVDPGNYLFGFHAFN